MGLESRKFTRVVVPLLVFVLCVLAAPVEVHSQESRFTEFHDWMDFASIYKLNEQWRYDGDYGVRGLIADPYWTLVYLRPSLRYRASNWFTAHMGAALFYNFLDSEENLPELRPHVGARFIWPRINGFGFSHFFRMEYRAFYLTADSEWATRFRGRYQIQLRSPDFSIGSAEDFYAITFIEFFEDFSSGTLNVFGDRRRIDVGVGKQVSAPLRIELNYLFHTLRIEDGLTNFDADDHVVRLRMFYKFR